MKYVVLRNAQVIIQSDSYKEMNKIWNNDLKIIWKSTKLSTAFFFPGAHIL